MTSTTPNQNEGIDPKTDGDHRFSAHRGSKAKPSTEGSEAAPQRLEKGINMSSLCRTLARVLVNLEAGEYTGNMRQDTVRQHDAPSDQASEAAPARLSE